MALYADADWFIEMECRTHFVDGKCPEDKAGFFVYGREYRMSQELKDMFRRKINARTAECFELRSFVFTDKTGMEMKLILSSLYYLIK